MKHAWLSLIVLLVLLTPCRAQRTINLTASEVRIDSVLPRVSYSIPLCGAYLDSVYTVSLDYPEFIPMGNADVQRLQRITDASLPRIPRMSQQLSVARKKGSLEVSFVPLVKRGRKHQKLVSFVLRIDAKAKPARNRTQQSAAAPVNRYADHSVLAEGRWVKISVPASGIYQLTDKLLRNAGFADPSRVKVYGYGGALQPEWLTADYLQTTDDLHEVATCRLSDGRCLLMATGPVTWDSNHQRIRNPYANYGCYFLTEGDNPLTIDTETFLTNWQSHADRTHTLYEVDDYAWYQGGRNLYDATRITAANPRSITLQGAQDHDTGSLTVTLSADQATAVMVGVNGQNVGQLAVVSRGEYDAMRTATATFPVTELLAANNKVTLTPVNAQAVVRLDHISLYHATPEATPNLASATFPAPDIVGLVNNQNLHADGPADMIIIIPADRKMQEQAQRLADWHETHDTLRVRIVAADQLYNEFSSGTPDANAYRRYLKMLYDRATTEADQPRFLLLMGDGAWDNRMLTTTWRGYQPDQFLLCYESDNSYSRTGSYVCDDYFTLLDDGEGANLLGSDKSDVAVGRLPVRTVSQAEAVVDKIIAYADNRDVGSWQNLIVVMGDDGNENQHMEDADDVAKQVEHQQPSVQVRRILWDAYQRTSSATSNSYPDVTRQIRQLMNTGALVMNYSGHGAATSLSHEKVVDVTDFANAVSSHLPLWVAATCDIMPFDGQTENIGETALLNPHGGAIAFYGTTRTVFQSYNRLMNQTFMRHLLNISDGRPMPIGEAVRRAKNELITTGGDLTANKLQFLLLGDPALRLSLPVRKVLIDSINGVALTDTDRPIPLSAGTTVKVCGHVQQGEGADPAFNGQITATVCDAAETVVCRRNDSSQAQKAFVYTDHTHTLFTGSDSIRQGVFSFSFTVPRDISYSDAIGLLHVYAVNTDRTQTANGHCTRFTLGGTDANTDDNEGPEVYCYLNSSDFVDGGRVNPTPYFIAELEDASGINAAGNGLGHNLTLVIDGQTTQTYNLNDYFAYDFGSHTRGTVGFSIPQLTAGDHHLMFRAWDMQNNVTTRELNFRVVEGLAPGVFEVETTRNPATTTTGFRIIHDRVGTALDISIEVFDMAGRMLWQHRQQATPSDRSLTIDWDLSASNGHRLSTGVYLYRVRLGSTGGQQVSKTKKLIVLSNK